MNGRQLTKDEFLARCALVYDLGIATPERLSLMRQWLDAVMRYEADMMGNPQQIGIFDQTMELEKRRLEAKTREMYGESEALRGCTYTLANDRDGYALQELASILDHPCQICATDPNAWHTRYGFCPHRTHHP